MIGNYYDIYRMIWLASFPRSGNTFFRNILFEVYGIPSSTFHRDSNRVLDEDYASYPVIKTHLLPSDLPSDLQNHPAVYLVRDAREALVSIAHHRKDIAEPGSDYYNNLLEAILSPDGANFGGWSENLRQWQDKTTIIIRFEDLIRNPIREVEKLRAIMDLPPPDTSKIPSFEQLKFGRPKYGAGSGDNFSTDLAQKHFRKGKTGSWKEEMPPELERLVYDIHGDALAELSYIKPIRKSRKKKKVLVEALKLFTPNHDGVKRYQLELMQNFRLLLQYKPDWQIDLFYNENILPLADLEQHVVRKFKRKETLVADHKAELKEAENLHLYDYENKLMEFKAKIKDTLPNNVYQILSWPYRILPFRAILNTTHRIIKRKKIHEVNEKHEGRLDSYDIVFTPLPQHHSFVAELKGQHVVTVHDLTHRLFPEFHTTDNTQKSEAGMQAIVRQNIPLISISEATSRDLMKLYDYPKDKIELIYEAANSDFNLVGEGAALTPVLDKYNLPNSPYFITLSTVEPRKNLKNVILAFQAYKAKHKTDVSLFICGKKGWLFEDLFTNQEELREAGVYFTGFVDDADLPLLYARSLALCYLSYYEGFGLPILEAMQCGTPVIFGNNSSMPEVAGAGGIGVDVANVTAIKEAMWQISSDPELQNSLSQAAIQQTKKFTWLKTALQTLDYFERLI